MNRSTHDTANAPSDTTSPEGHAAETAARRTWSTTPQMLALVELAARPVRRGRWTIVPVTVSPDSLATYGDAA